LSISKKDNLLAVRPLSVRISRNLVLQNISSVVV
jgi:hypothetical protein